MTDHRLIGPFELNVEFGGRVRFDLQPTNSPHRHLYYELCVVTAGTGIYVHGGRAFDLARGSVLIARPGVLHEISSYETRDLELYFASFDVQSVKGGFAPSPDGELWRTVASSSAVVSAGRAHLASYGPILEAGIASGALLYEFIRELASALIGGEANTLPLAGHHDWWERIRGVAPGATRVETVANRLGVCPRTLQRRMKSAGLRGAKAELDGLRMREAAHRLLMGFSVGEVASEFGFADSASFGRCFRRAIGQNPKRFQTQYRPGQIGQTLA